LWSVAKEQTFSLFRFLRFCPTPISLQGWQAAGLNVASGVKAQLATVEERLVVQIVGSITAALIVSPSTADCAPGYKSESNEDHSAQRTLYAARGLDVIVIRRYSFRFGQGLKEDCCDFG
jgi:hypothetical protein